MNPNPAKQYVIYLKDSKSFSKLEVKSLMYLIQLIA